MQDDGYIAKILVEAGTKDIKVGTALAILVGEAWGLEKSPHFPRRRQILHAAAPRSCMQILIFAQPDFFPR